MRKGKGAQQAVWVKSVMEEAAQQRGLASAAVVVDLVKAFEQVMLQLVWSAGLEHGFPMGILRLSMEACAFPRRMVFRGAHSQGQWRLCQLYLQATASALTSCCWRKWGRSTSYWAGIPR